MTDGEPEMEGLALARSTEAEYCRAALARRHSEFWWYLTGLAPFRGYTRPFADRQGRWWYSVKVGFAWPVDFFKSFTGPPLGLATKLRLLGWQYPTAPDQGNSRTSMNIIADLSQYGMASVESSKRRAVRKAARELDFLAIDPSDATMAGEWGCQVWNSHVLRTSWNSTMTTAQFCRSWRDLAGWPGTTVLVAREKSEARRICAWLIARVVDDTVFVDTIASHSEYQQSRPNDGLVFTCLHSGETDRGCPWPLLAQERGPSRLRNSSARSASCPTRS